MKYRLLERHLKNAEAAVDAAAVAYVGVENDITLLALLETIRVRDIARSALLAVEPVKQ